jgi:hypothetical protein
MNPNLFSHAFDHRVAIEATRQALEIMESPGFAKDTIGVVDAPKSKSDEDILVRICATWLRRLIVARSSGNGKDLLTFGRNSGVITLHPRGTWLAR